MHGVGPSTVLGGRYAVQRRLEQMPGAERWAAHDTTLERDVVVVCFAEAHPYADATLDAARRVAGLDNPRLVRVLDVGRSDGVAFFVEEALHGAHTLTELLAQGALPSEEARRIAGETATGLEAARARGLHHLRLTPASVLRAADGHVKLSGVATAAALAGVDDVDSVDASRHDTVGVVALAYAALTSRWPLPGPVPGLEGAPHVVGGVPAPSEIAAGVPGDLDALCRLTLNDDEGPVSPGDFASQIAPWSPIEVTGMGGAARTRLEDEGAATRGLNQTLALPIGTGEQEPRPAGEQEPIPESAPQPPARPVVRPDRAPAAASPPPPPPRAGGARPPLADRGGGGPVPHRGPGGQHDRAEGGGTAAGAAAAGAAAAGAAQAAAGAVGSALGTAGHAAGHAAGVAAQRVGTFARAAADKAAERKAARIAAEERAERDRIYLDDALVDGAEELDPPLPLLPPETAAAPTRDQSKLVLGIIAAFLVVATILAFWGVSRIGANSDLGLGSGSTPRPTVTVTGPPTTVPATPTPQQPDPQGEPLAILRATGFDPEGDRAERNSEAGRVYDGDPATFWSSEGYASADLGGLKQGVGVLVDLGRSATVRQVDLQLPDTSDVRVYVAPDRSTDGAAELGGSQGKKGRVSVRAAAEAPSGQYVIVWFTRVSQVSDGRFRATLAEVTVR